MEGAGRAVPAPVCLPPSQSKKQAGHRNAGTGEAGAGPTTAGGGQKGGQCGLEPVVSPEIHRCPMASLPHVLPQDAGPRHPVPSLGGALWRFLAWGWGAGVWGESTAPSEGPGISILLQEGPPSLVFCVLRHLFLLNEPLSRQRSVCKGGIIMPHLRAAGAVNSFPCAPEAGSAHYSTHHTVAQGGA